MNPEYVHTAVGAMGVVVNAANEVLLVLSKDRGWEPPMGFLEHGESPLLAVQREVLEESGYTMHPRRLTGVYHCIRDGVPIISFCFLCSVGELRGVPDAETFGVQWVARDKLQEIITYPPHLVRIMDALSSSGVSFRDYQIRPFHITQSWFLANDHAAHGLALAPQLPKEKQFNLGDLGLVKHPALDDRLEAILLPVDPEPESGWTAQYPGNGG